MAKTETQGGTILVTGGSRGIGAAICRKLAHAGWSVAVNYSTNPDKAEAVAEEIRMAGGEAMAVRGDIGDPAQIPEMFEKAVFELGPLAGLVNNAGIVGDHRRMDEREPEELRRLFDVNVLGTMLCAREAIRHLSTRHGGAGGSIVNVSSVAARLGGLEGMVPYATTKGAVEAFTRGLANEVGREGIRVNTVAPGLTETDMMPTAAHEIAAAAVPMGRVGQAAEVAEAVLWLVSPAASYVTGTLLTVSGGR